MLFTIKRFNQDDKPQDIPDGSVIELITPADLDTIADGTVLYCISGARVVKGQDYIDGDTRFGYLAYGYLVAG